MTDTHNAASTTDTTNETIQEAACTTDKCISFPCDQSGVLKLLPHRDPFVWVTRILECEPGKSIVAELDVDPNLPLFQGHFPDYPVFPGVLIMEALAQTACCCIMADPERATSIGFFAGIDKAKFREQVRPGDTITLKANITKANKRFCKAEVVAEKDGKVAAEALQSYMLADADKMA